MDDALKVYTIPLIEDTPFPNEVSTSLPISQPSGGKEVFTIPKVPDNGYPLLRVAQELLSTALDTNSKKILQEFQFAQSGALQIGTFTVGVSGDIRITPNGITARDKAGNITFDLDGDAGNATFSGTITGQSLIADTLALGGNNIVLDGNGQRITMTDTDGNVRLLIGESL